MRLCIRNTRRSLYKDTVFYRCKSLIVNLIGPMRIISVDHVLAENNDFT